MRQRHIRNLTTGEDIVVEFTVQEEADADSAAAADAAIDYDLSTLNAALTQEGSVLRALAQLTLQEINTLRVKAGLTAYTQQQFVTALKAKMR